MNIHFYYNKSDNRQINKELTDGESFTGTLRKETNVINPVITINSTKFIKYNYCYVEEFHRYYYVKSITSIRNGLWELELDVDPLMSFKNDILGMAVVVNKQSNSSNGDEYIDDKSLVADNLMIDTIYNFSNGFNNSGEYILITVG